MKRAKRIYILLGVLVVLCAVTFAVSRYNEKQEQIKNSNEVVLSIDPETVTALSWETEENSLAFHKDTETGEWIYDDDEAFPTSTDMIESLLSVFEEYEADFIIEEVEDYSQYGLDDPVCTINVTLEDETVYEITLGSFSTLDEERYISYGDGNVYLATVDPLDSYDVELSDMILHDSLDSISEASSITFSGAENYSIYYEEESDHTYCAEDLYFVTGTDDPLDTASVEDYLKGFRNTTLYDYVTYNATEEELELYGMNDPVLTITIEYPYTETDEDGEETEVTRTVTLTVGVNQDELAEAEEEIAEAEDAEEGAEVDISTLSLYVRVDDSQIIYELTETRYEYLIACGYDDLRHAEVLTADFADIYQMDFTIEGTTYTIYSELVEAEDDEEEDTRTYYYYYDGVVVNADELEEDDDIENYRVEVDIDNLSEVLDAVTAESFTDEEPSDKEEISFIAYLDNENYPQVEVQLYRYDGTSCLAVIDGEPVSLVLRSSVVDLIETINAIVL
ncbi:MAG: DUF4340 domain-containing protein [Lachnospiraceae bacterium]|nr:DUF4340 domain-containing protein [Lachnospiraceae bacterium]